MSETKRLILSRREFLATTLLASGHALAQGLLPHRRKPAPEAPPFVYFGTGTGRGVSKGIYLSRFDDKTGKLTPPVLAMEAANPSFMAVHGLPGGQRVLYAVAEGHDEAGSFVSSYLVNKVTGALTALNRVSSGGAGPCYVSIDATGEAAFVANYGGGTIASFRVLPDGKLSEPVERFDFHDTTRFGTDGPNASRQMGPHPHSAMLSPDNRFLLVNDLGHDDIVIFPVDPVTAKLGTMEPHLFSNNDPGSGPRHIAFHPNGRWMYCVDEIDSTVVRFLLETTHKAGDSQALLVTMGPPVSVLAPGFPQAKNTAAEIAVSPEGFNLYVSNRGENTLVVFTIDQTSGDLTFVQRIDCGGRTPRHFTLTPSANWVVCGNQDSATVTVFHRDQNGGKLTGPTQVVPIDSVEFTLFV